MQRFLEPVQVSCKRIFCYGSCRSCSRDRSDQTRGRLLLFTYAWGGERIQQYHQVTIVFDASALTTSGNSLNDSLIPGPCMYPYWMGLLDPHRQGRRC